MNQSSDRPTNDALATPPAPTYDTLTAKRAAFVDHYLTGASGREAARRAGYKSPAVEGARLLSHANVRQALAERRAQLAAEAGASPEQVMSRWARTAFADPRDVVQLRRCACRYCHGRHGLYQWRSAREFEEARRREAVRIAPGAKHKDLRRKLLAGETEDPRMPQDDGGYGYTRNMPPNPDCAECDGWGEAHVYLVDSREALDGDVLIESIRETGSGVEVKLADRTKALENLARAVGVIADGKDGTADSLLRAFLDLVSSRAQSAPLADPSTRDASALNPYASGDDAVDVTPSRDGS